MDELDTDEELNIVEGRLDADFSFGVAVTDEG